MQLGFVPPILPSLGDDMDAFDNISKEEEVSDSSTEPPRSLQGLSVDDISLRDVPSSHVDYFSHDWREEDIWSSWQYVTSRRTEYSNGLRLENALWRTWAKTRYRLQTISPESLNWLKDCDVTWLYGPSKSSVEYGPSASPPPRRLGIPDSYPGRKPILKRRTAFEIMLQRPLPQHSLLQHTEATSKSQEADDRWAFFHFPRFKVDLDQLHCWTGSSIHSLIPTMTAFSRPETAYPCGQRHIKFNNEAKQCIGVEFTIYDDEWPVIINKSTSGEGLATTRPTRDCTRMRNGNTPHGSPSGDRKSIAPLPSTTLKYVANAPDPPPDILDGRPVFSLLLTYPSVGSLRLPEPQVGPPLDERDSEIAHVGDAHKRDCRELVEQGLSSHPVQFKRAGMLMPQSDGRSTFLNRLFDAVGIARDVAHAIWNVRWRR